MMLDELERLRERHQSVSEEASAAKEAVEQQDAAAQETGRLNAVAQSERARRRMAELQAALARMEDGSYGLCEESDEEIPFARLKAEPTTRFTVEALEQLGRDGVAGLRTGDDDRKAY
jgi:DnaK suppressor protein